VSSGNARFDHHCQRRADPCHGMAAAGYGAQSLGSKPSAETAPRLARLGTTERTWRRPGIALLPKAPGDRPSVPADRAPSADPEVSVL
jgi:hypothetical protein